MWLCAPGEPHPPNKVCSVAGRECCWRWGWGTFQGGEQTLDCLEDLRLSVLGYFGLVKGRTVNGLWILPCLSISLQVSSYRVRRPARCSEGQRAETIGMTCPERRKWRIRGWGKAGQVFTQLSRSVAEGMQPGREEDALCCPWLSHPYIEWGPRWPWSLA